jgi:hypothetical protein
MADTPETIPTETYVNVRGEILSVSEVIRRGNADDIAKHPTVLASWIAKVEQRLALLEARF